MTSVMMYIVLLLVLRNLVAESEAAALYNNLTVNQTSTIVLPCYNSTPEIVDWNYVNLERGIRHAHIFTAVGLAKKYRDTGRYSVTIGNGMYNLTITNIRVEESGEYICKQDQGFGDSLSTFVTVNDINECWLKWNGGCNGNATCKNTVGTFTCKCNDGFVGDGFQCEDIDECSLMNVDCGENSVCLNTVGSFECHCLKGFERIGNKPYCTDINECSSGAKRSCHQFAYCTNTPGSFKCSCFQGFEGDGVNCQDNFSVKSSPQMILKHTIGTSVVR